MTGNCECQWEQDVLDALASRRRPARCDEALRAHVKACAACADLAETAGALLNERPEDGPQPALPPASVVWWRAQLRAREEAAVAAARPLHVALGVAAACTAAAIAVFAVIFEAPFVAALQMTGSWVAAADVGGALLRAMSHPGALLAVAGWMVIAPVALYLALGRE